jgi:catalase
LLGLGATVPTVLETPLNKGVSPGKRKGSKNPVLWSHQLYRLLHFLCLKKPTTNTIALEKSGYYLCTWREAEEYENALLKEDKGFIIAPHLGSVRTDAEGAIALISVF